MSLASFDAASGIIAETPAAEEVEISVFGPGFGECVVVHLGSGRWMIVDSCIGRGRRYPAGLEYLDTLGVDVGESVEIVVASHWHDDHVRGISTVYEKATTAAFFASSAIRATEFLALADRGHVVSRFSSGVEELARVRAVANERRTVGGPALGLVGAVQRIWYAPDEPVTAVWSLSPSTEDAARSVQHIASLLPARPDAGVSRVPSLEPNDGSVVLLLETVAGAVLLGADLEHVSRSRVRGWHGVTSNRNRPPLRASLFKVAHHGSENADCPEVWEHLVDRWPVCVVTPFERGKTPLPRPSDRTRIRGYTPHAFLTSDKRAASIERDRLVRKMIDESTRSYRPESLTMGHVQARSTGAGWAVRMSSDAAVL